MADDRTRTTNSGPQPALEESDERGFEPGMALGPYVIEGTLGQGGFACVYSARHPVLGRQVAIKVLHGEMAKVPAVVQRFLREARVVNIIRHPNIVDVYDFGELPDRRPYFVMELLGGTTVRELVSAEGRRSPAETLALLVPVVSALEAAHAVGVVHRDLKPSNVSVDTVDGQQVVKLLDFGVAKLLYPDPGEPGLTAPGTSVGSPSAMAPEQILGKEVDGRTDVYALGVFAYYTLTGAYPFWSDSAIEIERMHLKVPAPAPSLKAPVPPAVDAVVLKCLEKDPANRYPTVRAFLEAMTAAVTGVTSGDERRRQPAIAVHVSLEVPPGREEDPDVLTELADALDGIEGDLRSAGLTLAMQTSGELVGVRVLPSAPQEVAELKSATVEAARALHLARNAPGQALRVNVCVHAGELELEPQTDGSSAFGGPLMRVTEWVVRAPSGWAVTPAV